MLPLNGLRIVVTRAAQQAEELAEPLRERGAIPILLPAIGIAPPANPGPLADALANLPRYDWIVFTSVNAIRAVGAQPACRARVATVGAATRDFAEEHGWRVSVTPETYVAESLAAALGVEDLQGCRILIPGAAIARDVVREELARRGALVDMVEAYRNLMPAELPVRAGTVFQPPFPDWITFASSSAVENLLSVISMETLRHSRIASIGPITSETIRRHSLTIAAEPKAHTVPALVAAIVQAVCASTA